MKVSYSAMALADLKWFRKYYRSIFPAGGKNGSAQYLATIRALQENPLLGKPFHSKSRMLVVPRTPFSVIYFVTEEEIVVTRVFDNRAEPAG